ncbi:FAS1-like dehydratase domain-containing protein [Pontivivens ytuae]|uniref:MaoC family dehydratase N-terminal domain-containing protein n=1 Tax=Pontivivens ytuae TaxID=2789856 RepID=A0A7S9LRM3_9RHOB|nr:MaoC family dehydratase N-terminal domain-containing protein [Pontivivens ytuae]QPH53861.1 MaoC family dehydratase N-terminal domain-containing protein [Pontivivens ytuae]
MTHPALGRSETREEVIDPARLAALRAALDLPEGGDTLPPFAHQIYFWQAERPAALGRDGHPATGGFIPDLGLPRRMWAGGRLTFTAPLRTGLPARKTTTITNIAEKAGRSGALAFVTLEHRFEQDGTLCVTEEQDLVYRPDDAPAAAPQPCERIEPEPQSADPTLLFRYSALTFNGHRIHYDADYARQVEGYPGLVVHGPLLAQLLALRAERTLVGLTTFTFRARSPVTAGEPFETCAEHRDGALHLWIRAADGRLAMTAEAT